MICRCPKSTKLLQNKMITNTYTLVIRNEYKFQLVSRNAQSSRLALLGRSTITSLYFTPLIKQSPVPKIMILKHVNDPFPCTLKTWLYGLPQDIVPLYLGLVQTKKTFLRNKKLSQIFLSTKIIINVTYRGVEGGRWCDYRRRQSLRCGKMNTLSEKKKIWFLH